MNRPLGSLARSAAAGIATVLFVAAADAQDNDRSVEMRALGNCGGCAFDGQDFSGFRLMGIDLGEARLTDLSFDRARLGVAIFDGANLTDVSFDGTDLRGASFVGARLVDVTFTGANLRGAVFEGAILTRTDLRRARLCNTQMPDDEMENSNCD